ncbi:hypothetical protein BpHYR1_042852 [Brachionus plicatilis]|uniref:Uncharacterized protein n=1 Tax=Brachionus plicatilis TaxID=10195 RepID=A0A3M7PPH2_BRAPC|nr:hypothetical protein BpHYR1_042852 [Brachionus plicatilis]
MSRYSHIKLCFGKTILKLLNKDFSIKFLALNLEYFVCILYKMLTFSYYGEECINLANLKNNFEIVK